MNNAGDFGKTNPIFRRQKTEDRNKKLKGDNYDEKTGIFGGEYGRDCKERMLWRWRES